MVQTLAEATKSNVQEKSKIAPELQKKLVCEEVLDKLKEIGLDGKFKKEGNQTILSVEEKSDGKGIKDVTEVQTEDSKGQDGI